MTSHLSLTLKYACSRMIASCTSEADQVSLQRDLTTLERWGDTWGMKFNSQKCQIMTIARGRRHFFALLYTLQAYPGKCAEGKEHTFHMILHEVCGIYINSLRPRRNRRHFADDTFKYIFFNENVIVSVEISLKFVPKGPINNIPTLVQIMAWRRPGDKPLSEPMIVRIPTHICVTRPQWDDKKSCDNA